MLEVERAVKPLGDVGSPTPNSGEDSWTHSPTPKHYISHGFGKGLATSGLSLLKEKCWLCERLEECAENRIPQKLPVN